MIARPATFIGAASKSRAEEPAPGERFGRLTVIRKAEPINYKRRFLCVCDCGTEKVCLSFLLLSGRTRSCGCLHKETAAKLNRAHGEATKKETPEYRAWKGMRTRCNNPKFIQAKNYGGRGIMVCERWDDYAAFLSDMGRRPSTRHSLDRIDVNKGYSPDNCRWATKEQQANNTRRSVIVVIRGREMTLAQAARFLGLPYGTVRQRYRSGRPLEPAK